MPAPNIFAIGDSHCIFYYDSHKIKNHWVGWGGMPVTMYTFVQSGIPLYNIVERMPPGDICPINVQENDIVLFCYGWNDVQKNIHTYSNGDYKSMIDGLVSQYIEIIKHYSDGTLFKIRPIINCVYPLPLSTNESMTGTDQDRILYTRYMNERLQAVCLENKIPFFDIYDLISVDDKLDMQYVDKDMTHLNRKLPELREIIELKLLKICEDICK